MFKVLLRVGLLLLANSDGEDVVGVDNLVVSMAVDGTRQVLGVVDVLGLSINVLAANARNASEAKDGGVDGRLSTSEDKDVVQEASESAANAGSDNGNPEVVVTSLPDVSSVAQNV